MSRFKAVIIVLLLIGALSIVCIGSMTQVTTRLVQGNNVQHEDGKVSNITVAGSVILFDLHTSEGRTMHCRCDIHCRASLDHLKRHQREGAHTDVYYSKEEPGDTLIVVDVD